MTLDPQPAPGDAGPGAWKQVARSWARFIARPVPRFPVPVPLAKRPARLLLSLLSMATPLALVAALFVAPFSDDVGLRSRIDFRFSVFEALLVLVLAPAVEELVFRGPFGSRRAFERTFVWLPLAALGAAAMWWAHRFVLPPGAWPLRVGALLFVLALVLAAGLWLDDRLERWRFTRVPAGETLFVRHFAVVAHLGTLAFALSHASNYALSWEAIWFLPLAVLPQLVLGYACLFARCTVGLRGAMLLHSAHNAVAYSIAGLAR